VSIAASHGRPHAAVLAATALIGGALLVPAFGQSQIEQRPPARALEVTRASSTSVTVEWREADGRADAFAVFVDGRRIATTAVPRYTVTALACSRAYTIGVAVLDGAGGLSEAISLTAAPTTCAERTHPGAPVPRPTEPRPPVVVQPQPDAPGSETATGVSTIDRPSSPTSPSLWQGAGAFVWHETDVAPEELGTQLREAGFAWVVVLVHDGTTIDPIADDWARRFREASGLPVGGWGVLRTNPEREAELAHELLDRYSLDFYVANAEAEYKYSGDDGQSGERFERSHRFVEAFRALEPDIPAALSSYCRPDRADIDWEAWTASGFAFLPQAYVNDFGGAASPESCLDGATEFFSARQVHPTVGVYESLVADATTERYAELLEEAGTVGFSIYLAETRMHMSDWGVLAGAIDESKIAVEPTAHPTGSSVVTSAEKDVHEAGAAREHGSR
jgi:hypothetical protein